MVVGCLLFIAYHLQNLVRLVRWTQQPINTPTPHASGIWDFAFANLSRRVRVASDQRERLATALGRFREASQAMPDGVLYLSKHHLIEWINRAAEQHFGLDTKRDAGQPVTNLLRQPDFVRYVENGDYSEPIVINPLRHDGRTLQLQIVPFGEDQHMILSRDITQIERLETMRRDFVANVSHELKTPLTVVNGFVEMLHDSLDAVSPDDARRYLGLALEQSGRMQRLIDDLLALSALETANAQPADDLVDVQALIQSVGQDLQILSAGRHQIHVDLGPRCQLHGAQKELHSVFSNLASNAVRYSPEGGDIRIAWQIQDDVGAFSVQDSGIGIAPEHIPRLTERFYRVDRGRSRDSGGTGLGLAIVKHVLTRHQGLLAIESAAGKGSCFRAEFPLWRITQPSDSPPAA